MTRSYYSHFENFTGSVYDADFEPEREDEKHRSIPAEFVFPKQVALAKEAGMTLEEYLEKRRRPRPAAPEGEG